ncbi:MAG: hypothetical protein K0Q90_2585 [Paenibacillaceae bacterium]|nr:hypothetical protein [Paenibacillaceae bacterium]
MKEVGLNYVGELMELAESLDIDVCLYYIVDTDEEAARRFPEWIAVDPWGALYTAGGRWKRCSISPAHGYLDYMCRSVREILELFRPAGLFFDCFPSVLCFCGSCREHYRKVTGRPMPVGDEVHHRWRELQDYEAEHYWFPFALRIRELIDAVSPGTAFTSNGCNANMPDGVRRLLDYHFAEPWAGNYYSAAFARDVMNNAQIGPGNIGVVYDSFPADQAAGELLAIGMQGSRPFWYSESMLPDGSLLPNECRRIGQAYAKVQEVEPYWSKGLPVADIAILYSCDSHRYDPDRKAYMAYWWERGSGHLKGMEASMALASSQHRGYKVIREECLRELLIHPAREKPLLLAPDCRVISDSAWAGLTEYVQQGGTLIMSLPGVPVLQSGVERNTEAADRLLGVRIKGQTQEEPPKGITRYIRAEAAPAEWGLPQLPLSVCGSKLIVQATAADALAQFAEPVIAENVPEGRWMAWRTPPPGNTASGPAIVRHRLGLGQVILFCFDIFGMCQSTVLLETGFAQQGSQPLHWPVALLQSLMDQYAHPPVHVQGLPRNVKVSIRSSGDVYDVHLLNQHPLVGQQFVGALQRNGVGVAAKAVRQLYPERSCVSIIDDGNGSKIVMPADEMYIVLELRVKE